MGDVTDLSVENYIIVNGEYELKINKSKIGIHSFHRRGKLHRFIHCEIRTAPGAM